MLPSAILACITVILICGTAHAQFPGPLGPSVEFSPLCQTGPHHNDIRGFDSTPLSNCLILDKQKSNWPYIVSSPILF